MSEPNYDFYFAALAGKAPPMDQNSPQPGFYRRKRDLVGIAIWHDTTGLIASVDRGDEEHWADDARDVWHECAAYPVKEEYYRHWVDTGQWPDALPNGVDSTPTNEAMPWEELEDQIDSALQRANYASIHDDASRDAAQSLRARLNELSGAAKKRHDEEKAPALAECKTVDERWLPMVKRAKGAADRLRVILSDYETAQRNARLAAERKAEEERARQEADSPTAGGPTPLPPPPQETRIRGAYGRGAGRHVRPFGIIKDWGQAGNYVILDTRVQATILKVIQERIDAGERDIPGVDIEEKVDVR